MKPGNDVTDDVITAAEKARWTWSAAE